MRDMEAKVQASNKAIDEAESSRTFSCTQQLQDQNPSVTMLSSIQHVSYLQTVTEAITETDATVAEVRVGDVYPEARVTTEMKKGKSYASPTKCSAAKIRPTVSGR